VTLRIKARSKVGEKRTEKRRPSASRNANPGVAHRLIRSQPSILDTTTPQGEKLWLIYAVKLWISCSGILGVWIWKKIRRERL
jgi:hypothetical protein